MKERVPRKKKGTHVRVDEGAFGGLTGEVSLLQDRVREGGERERERTPKAYICVTQNIKK